MSLERLLAFKNSADISDITNQIEIINEKIDRKMPATQMSFEHLTDRSGCIFAVSFDDGVAYGIDHTWISKTTDGWITKTKGVQFEWETYGLCVSMCAWEDGSVVIATDTGHIVHMDSISASQVETLNTGKPFANLSVNYYSDGTNKFVIAGEYPKDTFTPAKLYLSKDGGLTFTVIKEGDTLGSTNNHWHGNCYDPYTGAIWVGQGDSENAKLYFTYDLGISWNEVSIPNGFRQPTLIHSFPKKVIFGRDDTVTSPGLDQYIRPVGDQSTDVILTDLLSFRTDLPAFYFYPGRGKLACVDDNTAYIAFSSEDSDLQYIYATGDGGRTWHCVFTGISPIVSLGTDGTYLFMSNKSPIPNSIHRSKLIVWS